MKAPQASVKLKWEGYAKHFYRICC